MLSGGFVAKFMVQSVIANAGKFSAAELAKLNRTTRDELKKLGHSIHLVQNFVTCDNLHCVYVVNRPDQIPFPPGAETLPSLPL